MKPTPLWRTRDYLLLWGGQTVSLVGTSVSQLAFPLLTLVATGSAAQAGLVGAARGLPLAILSLPAGVLVDRWNRKRVMIICDMGRVLALGSLALALALGHVSILLIYGAALIEGTLFAFFNLAETAALPQVVAPEQIDAAAAQYEASANVSYLIGPLLGGALYAASWALPFAADALSYAVSVGTVALIHAPLGKPHVETDTAHNTNEAPRQALVTLFHETREGLLWLWRQPLLRLLALLTGAVNSLLISLELVVIVLAHQAHLSSVLIGALLTAGGMGGVIGAALSGPARKTLPFRWLVIGVFWALTLLTPLYAWAAAPFALGAVFVGTTLLGPLFNVAQFSYRLGRIPNELQGRVNSLYGLVALGVQPLGLALTGVLLQRFGVFGALGALSAVLLAFALVVSVSPSVRAAL